MVENVLVHPLPLYKQINRYARKKTLQAAFWFIIPLIVYASILMSQYSEGKRPYIRVHIIAWITLLRGIFAAIAAVLLHLGNKNENIKLLKAFSAFRYLSYTLFDFITGSKIVKKRMMEIMAKHSGNPDLAYTSHSNPVPIV